MSREDKLEAELLKKARIEALKKTMEIEKQKREEWVDRYIVTKKLFTRSQSFLNASLTFIPT